MANFLSYLKTFYVKEIILDDLCEQLFDLICTIYIFFNFGPFWLFTVLFGNINSGNNETLK